MTNVVRIDVQNFGGKCESVKVETNYDLFTKAPIIAVRIRLAYIHIIINGSMVQKFIVAIHIN